MTTIEWLSLFGTFSAAVVALLLFVGSSILKARQDARELRRLLVARILTTIEHVVKQSVRPLILTMWNRNEIDLALIQTRLALDLPEGDVAISQWLWGQTQKIYLAKTDNEATRVATGIAMRLALWHNGAISRKWFESELLSSPVIAHFTIPKRLKRKKTWKLVKEAASLWGVVAGAALIVKEVNR
jgi:hypothetical protein